MKNDYPSHTYYGTSHEFSFIDNLGTFRDKIIYQKNNISIRDLLIGYINFMENVRHDFANIDKKRCIERAVDRLGKLNEGGECLPK